MYRLAAVLPGLAIALGIGGAFFALADEAQAANVCGSREIWIDDLAYGTPGGGVYWDPLASKVWAPAGGWHYFAPDPPRPNPEPLWVNQLDYPSQGGGFYWDPVSGQVWTPEHGWHVHSANGCEGWTLTYACVDQGDFYGWTVAFYYAGPGTGSVRWTPGWGRSAPEDRPVQEVRYNIPPAQDSV